MKTSLLKVSQRLWTVPGRSSSFQGTLCAVDERNARFRQPKTSACSCFQAALKAADGWLAIWPRFEAAAPTSMLPIGRPLGGLPRLWTRATSISASVVIGERRCLAGAGFGREARKPQMHTICLTHPIQLSEDSQSSYLQYEVHYSCTAVVVLVYQVEVGDSSESMLDTVYRYPGCFLWAHRTFRSVGYRY